MGGVPHWQACQRASGLPKMLLLGDIPDSSVAEESACKAGDPDSVPGSGRYTGKGIGYPLQYSWASLVVQLVKNLPAMWETWVRSLGWEDSPGEGKGYPLQYSGLKYSPWSRKESERLSRTHSLRGHLPPGRIFVLRIWRLFESSWFLVMTWVPSEPLVAWSKSGGESMLWVGFRWCGGSQIWQQPAVTSEPWRMYVTLLIAELLVPAWDMFLGRF